MGGICECTATLLLGLDTITGGPARPPSITSGAALSGLASGRFHPREPTGHEGQVGSRSKGLLVFLLLTWESPDSSQLEQVDTDSENHRHLSAAGVGSGGFSAAVT